MKSGPPADLMRRQTRQFYLVGGIVVALTALIAFLFSRHLLKPVRRLTEGTRELANRNFSVRIRSTTRDELDQLAGTSTRWRKPLEVYEKMRCQWLTDISHELRTPLAVLLGEIEALEDGVCGSDPGESGVSAYGGFEARQAGGRPCIYFPWPIRTSFFSINNGWF